MVLRNIRYIFTLLLIICFSKFSLANENNIEAYQDSLNYYFTQLGSERNDIIKEELNDKILSYFRKALAEEESFEFYFSKLKHVGIIYSDKRDLRIISWNLPYNDRTHKYFGFIQYKKSKRKTLLFELYDKSEEIKNPEIAVLSNQNWYGALYYKIIENKYRGNTYYTILGSDLNDLLSKKKIIEILSFDRNDNPVFGKNVFKNKLGAVTRVIFEYNAQANMVLTYDKDKEMIIYDHLSPSKPSLTGQFEFYGPDFSYDGLKFERGIWNLYSDIDVRNYNVD